MRFLATPGSVTSVGPHLSRSARRGAPSPMQPPLRSLGGRAHGLGSRDTDREKDVGFARSWPGGGRIRYIWGAGCDRLGGSEHCVPSPKRGEGVDQSLATLGLTQLGFGRKKALLVEPTFEVPRGRGSPSCLGTSKFGSAAANCAGGTDLRPNPSSVRLIPAGSPFEPRTHVSNHLLLQRQANPELGPESRRLVIVASSFCVFSLSGVGVADVGAICGIVSAMLTMCSSAPWLYPNRL